MTYEYGKPQSEFYPETYQEIYKWKYKNIKYLSDFEKEIQFDFAAAVLAESMGVDDERYYDFTNRIEVKSLQKAFLSEKVNNSYRYRLLFLVLNHFEDVLESLVEEANQAEEETSEWDSLGKAFRAEGGYQKLYEVFC